MDTASNDRVSPDERICILIAGMHRSGTSALTRTLNLLGCRLADDLLEAKVDDNPTGFWEARTVVDLDEEILSAMGSHWIDCLPVDRAWFTSPECAGFADRAASILTDAHGEDRLFAIKDPRIARLLPFWCDVVEKAGIRPVVVIPVRHPDETAASVADRNDYDPAVARLSWLEHMLAAERDSRGRLRVFVRYADLVTDWRGVAGRIAGATGISWPVAPDDAATALDAFIEPGLRHHAENGAPEDGAAAEWLAGVWGVLDRWADKAEDEAGKRTLDTIGSAFALAANAFAPAVRHSVEAARLERRCRALEEKDADLRERLERNRAARLERDGRLREAAREKGALRAELRRREREIADLTRAVVKSQTQAEETATEAAGLVGRIGKALTADLGLFRLPLLSRLKSAKRRDMARRKAWLRECEAFDAEWYRNHYRDVAEAGADPLTHYITCGAEEGRLPNPRIARALKR